MEGIDYYMDWWIKLDGPWPPIDWANMTKKTQLKSCLSSKVFDETSKTRSWQGAWHLQMALKLWELWKSSFYASQPDRDGRDLDSSEDSKTGAVAKPQPVEYVSHPADQICAKRQKLKLKQIIGCTWDFTARCVDHLHRLTNSILQLCSR